MHRGCRRVRRQVGNPPVAKCREHTPRIIIVNLYSRAAHIAGLRVISMRLLIVSFSGFSDIKRWHDATDLRTLSILRRVGNFTLMELQTIF